LRRRDTFLHRALRAVRDVDDDAIHVELLDEETAEHAEAGVAGLGRAVAVEIAPLVRQLDAADAERADRRDVIEVVADRLGALEAQDQAELVLALRTREVGR